MQFARHRARTVPEASAVVSKALQRAAERLDMKQKDLAAALGVSTASASRLAAGDYRIEPASKEGELALLLLRAWRSLDALVGGNEDKARRWFHAPNAHLGRVPAEMVRTVEGLLGVVHYLDALRAKV
jgi:uncharacterized protein (DUF2384 family)